MKRIFRTKRQRNQDEHRWMQHRGGEKMPNKIVSHNGKLYHEACLDDDKRSEAVTIEVESDEADGDCTGCGGALKSEPTAADEA